MELIPTFVDENFRGYNTLKVISKLRTEYHEIACEQQKEKQADHMMYCHYDLKEDGTIRLAWLYSGIAMTDEEFEKISSMSQVFIGAIHKLK